MVRRRISYKKIVFILSIILIVLTGVRLGWIFYYDRPSSQLVENGVLDLTDTKLDDQTIISLNGEWVFYPNEFVRSDNVNEGKDATLVKVPSNWSEAFKEQDVTYGTYQIRILLPDHTDSDQIYGLRLKNIESATKIYINGKLQKEIGQLAESKEEVVSRLGTDTVFFQDDHRELNISIQVANFEEVLLGGITKSVKFGTHDAIEMSTSHSKMMQLTVVFIILIHSVYAFGLYITRRGFHRKHLMYFFLLLIFAAFSIVVDEDKLLFTIFPVEVTWSFRLLYLSFAGTVFFMLMFITEVFSVKSKMKHVIATMYIILLASLFVLPPALIPIAGLGISLTNVFTYAYITVIVLKEIRNGNSDAMYLLISNIVNLVNVLWGISINIELIEVPYYPIDYIVAIIAFAGFLFKRHFRIVRQNEQQKKELKKADKSKDQFLANTSHELRNPLHGMMNIAQSMLGQGSHLPSEQRKSLELLIRVARQMSFTLNNLLDASKLKDRQIQLNQRSVQLQTIVQGVIDIIHYMVKEKNIEVILNIPKNFPNVYVDKSRFIQIMFNLLHNAVKYTDEGTITIEAKKHKKMAIISVTDTGIGMSEEVQEIIFKPYEQAIEHKTAIEGGIGLGLSISKQLVELHGGEISVQSKLEEGSTFTFSIPLADRSVEEVKSEAEIATSILTEVPLTVDSGIGESLAKDDHIPKEIRILAVDDDPINLQVLKQILEDRYDIETTSNGEEALKVLKNGSSDLVIADAMMPYMSGYELTKIIRKQFTIGELPILILTARARLEDIYAGFQAGANDYVVKPVDAIELQARVRALTDLKQSIKEQLRLEAAWLQAQIQPHFLFNTLNTIASLGVTDTNRMIKLLEEFGNYLNKSFKCQNADLLVSIDHELELTRSYLYIEKERFKDRLQVHWDIQNKIKLNIPPLTIQPIVENAVNHGILKQVEGGTVWIRIKEYESYYKIEVEDNGVGMEQDQVDQILATDRRPVNGVGFYNTNRRLIKLYGKGLNIQSKVGEGTTVSFEIPKGR